MSGINELFAVFADSALENGEVDKTRQVGRLTEMDTKEVSLVDRAANKRQFLVIKRDGENNMSGENLNDDSATSVKDVPTAKNGTLSILVQHCANRVTSLKAIVSETTESDSSAGLPNVIAREIRSVQQILKTVAGNTLVAGILPVEKISDYEFTLSSKEKADVEKRLDEVLRRLETAKADIADSEILDSKQSQSLNRASDILGNALRAHPNKTMKTAKLATSSIPEGDRAEFTEAVEKALHDLFDLRLALDTDAPNNAKVAKTDVVMNVVHDATSLLTRSITKFAGEGREDTVAEIVEKFRAIEVEKSVELKLAMLNEAMNLVGQVMFRMEEFARSQAGLALTKAEGDEQIQKAKADEAEAIEKFEKNKETIVESLLNSLGYTKTEKTEEADETSTTEAEVTKTFKVRQAGDTYQVFNDEDNKLVASGLTEADAKAQADELNKKTKKADESESDESAETQKQEVDQVETKTEKVGKPMNATRLTRLKGVVQLFKEALGDLRSGAISMEKFRKVGDDLAGLISELQIEKRSAAAATGGVEDTRGITPDRPNVGSGVQTDLSVVGDMGDVMGEGTANTADILKQIEELKAKTEETAKAVEVKDAEIAALKSQLTSLKKTRSAPSTAPGADHDNEKDLVSTAKGSDNVAWPMDMNSYQPKTK